ncbi:hypothetical protein HU200_016327 [Digitaria exilis]|uniref:Protein kinase domain-containing protein n=1 Tax=Digitaria exilis TaxID=1010633 RepID=A0A835KI28_9POAL|nr:hypothetical protein HU200_016327 [Digitaria exilis]
MAAQYLGLLNTTNNGNSTNHVFAVELDTMQNNEFKDISDNHVGIDISSLISVNSTNAGYHAGDGAGDFHSLTLISHEAMQVWVDYDGLVNSRHYVLGWSFAMDGPAPEIDIAKLPKLPREFPKPRSKVLEIMLPIATAVVVLFVGTGSCSTSAKAAEAWYCQGIASGLIYLHEEWEKVVVHRDIKASNVLLDGGMNGRLGDFGLAMLYDHSDNPQTSHVVGTIGYLAPELGRTSKATTLTDIFAFGYLFLRSFVGKSP